jgi:hypothetical protein
VIHAVHRLGTLWRLGEEQKKDRLFVKKVTSQNYKKEKLYSSVVRAVEELLQAGPVVTPIDLLLKTERVAKGSGKNPEQSSASKN